MRFKSTGMFNSSYSSKDVLKYRFIKVKILLCDWRIAKITPFNLREHLEWLQMQSDAVDTSECIFKGRMLKEVMKITGN